MKLGKSRVHFGKKYGTFWQKVGYIFGKSTLLLANVRLGKT